ncbi:MAG: cellobiose 2-epimerase [Acidobacteriota bacterium]
MDAQQMLQALRAGAERELRENILPYWVQHSVDREQGGFWGRIDGANRIDRRADKGVVLNTRILWTFAEVWREFGDEGCKALADRAYEYVVERFWDPRHGGVYWMLDYTGRPVSPRKQVYAQAFAIYALVNYHLATGDSDALAKAWELFEILELKARDPLSEGYFEAFGPDWSALEDVRLSPRDLNEKKSMNTHLHLLEAYALLLEVTLDPRVQQRLLKLVELFLDHILDRRSGHLRLFFDEEWNVRSGVVSFGHDIEAAWLLGEAAGVLQSSRVVAEVQDATELLARAVLAEGVADDGGVVYERREDGTVDTDRHWWPQAEAVVGFLEAFRVTGDSVFLEAAARTWRYVEKYLVDREHGEWHWAVDAGGRAKAGEDKVGPWKGPYHNTRACLEIMRRAETLQSRTGGERSSV